MSEELKPGLGTFIEIVAEAPATEDSAGYTALTGLAEVGELTEVPEYGPEHDTVTHTPLKSGITAKYHGALNYGSLSLPMGLATNDAGQIALKTALASKARITMKVTYADGSTDFFQGKVMGFKRGASINGVVQATVKFEIETEVIEVAA